MRAPYRVGLLGLGNVGGALARRLVEDADRITTAAGRPITLEAIALAHPAGRRAVAPLLPAAQLLAQPQLDAIVELMGGLEPAHTYISTALEAGREVITANKQLIAAEGPQLARLGPLRFEASVASADVDAHDPAAKLAILAMLAFGRRIDPNTIVRVGIRDLRQTQLRAARERGCVVKLIASAQILHGVGIEADVRPRLIPLDEPMAHVDGAMNAIAIDAMYAGRMLLQGLGAGPDAAASAVLADLVRAARDMPASAGERLASLSDQPTATIAPLRARVPYPAAS